MPSFLSLFASAHLSLSSISSSYSLSLLSVFVSLSALQLGLGCMGKRAHRRRGQPTMPSMSSSKRRTREERDHERIKTKKREGRQREDNRIQRSSLTSSIVSLSLILSLVRHLRYLLCVMGRYCYIRQTGLILYSFYKSKRNERDTRRHCTTARI